MPVFPVSFRVPPGDEHYESNENEDYDKPFCDLHREPVNSLPVLYQKCQGHDKEHYREGD